MRRATNGFRQRPVKKQKTLDNATAAKYSELCKKYQCCTACGWLVDGQRKEVHAATRKCKANLFANRMALVAKMVEQGQDPNAELEMTGRARGETSRS
jgi:uncharacterized cysteine cluster protein YcgN (CxxCxxCC family)